MDDEWTIGEQSGFRSTASDAYVDEEWNTDNEDEEDSGSNQSGSDWDTKSDSICLDEKEDDDDDDDDEEEESDDDDDDDGDEENDDEENGNTASPTSPSSSHNSIQKRSSPGGSQTGTPVATENAADLMFNDEFLETLDDEKDRPLSDSSLNVYGNQRSSTANCCIVLGLLLIVAAAIVLPLYFLKKGDDSSELQLPQEPTPTTVPPVTTIITAPPLTKITNSPTPAPTPFPFTSNLPISYNLVIPNNVVISNTTNINGTTNFPTQFRTDLIEGMDRLVTAVASTLGAGSSSGNEFVWTSRYRSQQRERERERQRRQLQVVLSLQLPTTIVSVLEIACPDNAFIAQTDRCEQVNAEVTLASNYPNTTNIEQLFVTSIDAAVANGDLTKVLAEVNPDLSLLQVYVALPPTMAPSTSPEPTSSSTFKPTTDSINCTDPQNFVYDELIVGLSTVSTNTTSEMAMYDESNTCRRRVQTTVDSTCSVTGTDMVCPADTNFFFDGQQVSLAASVTCPLDAVQNSDYITASQQGLCTCETPALDCDCFACPLGSRIQFAFQCQETLVGPCFDFSCSGECNAADLGVAVDDSSSSSSSSLLFPHVIDQCRCNGTISIIPDDVMALRSLLLDTNLLSIVYDEDEGNISQGYTPENAASCHPVNMALVWLASGVKNSTIVGDIRQRFILATMFLQLNGTAWNQTSGWFTDSSECLWFGVTCNPQGVVTGISLNTNNIFGSLPIELSKLMGLQSLDLSLGRLSGTLPSALFSIPCLSELDLGANLLTGSIPTTIQNASQLERLRLSGNQLAGDLISEIGMVSRLTELDISSNAFFRVLPTELGALVDLKDLNVANNLFSGSFPPEIGNISSLETLALANNLLTGSIPNTLGLLQNLQELRISRTGLGGTLPNEMIANWTNLQYLDAAFNTFTGTLPPSLGLLTNLVALGLSDCLFTGPIPSNLGNLTGLTRLQLQNNQLSGPVPSTFGLLVSLEEATLEGNALLSGVAPTELCALRMQSLTTLIMDCPDPISGRGVNCSAPDCCSSCRQSSG